MTRDGEGMTLEQVQGLLECPDLRTHPRWVQIWHHGYQTTNYGKAGGTLRGVHYIERAMRPPSDVLAEDFERYLAEQGGDIF